MFETINNWIVEYMETPHYQRTIECDCLFYLAISIYAVIVIGIIVLIWLCIKKIKNWTDKVAEREAEYRKAENNERNTENKM